MIITADTQPTSPPRVVVTVTAAPAGGVVTVYRVVGQTQTIVRGLLDREPSAGAVTGVDSEQPLNREFIYRAVHTSDTGTVTQADSGPALTESALPWLVDPIRAVGLQVEIQAWPSLQRRSRRQIVEIPGARFPAVISDSHIAASSQIVFMVRDEQSLIRLRELISVPRLLLRPVGPAVEPGYFSFGDLDENRMRDHDPSSWNRLIPVSLQEVAAPPASIPGIGDTLMDLHEYVGGEGTTLADLVSTFGPGSTLLDIAQTQLKVSG